MTLYEVDWLSNITTTATVQVVSMFPAAERHIAQMRSNRKRTGASSSSFRQVAMDPEELLLQRIFESEANDRRIAAHNRIEAKRSPSAAFEGQLVGLASAAMSVQVEKSVLNQILESWPEDE